MNGLIIWNESDQVSVPTKKLFVIHKNWIALGNGDASNLGRSGETSLFCAGRGVLDLSKDAR